MCPYTENPNRCRADGSLADTRSLLDRRVDLWFNPCRQVPTTLKPQIAAVSIALFQVRVHLNLLYLGSAFGLTLAVMWVNPKLKLKSLPC